MNPRILLFIFVACLAAFGPARAQPTDTERTFAATSAQWDASLEQVRRRLTTALSDSSDLKLYRDQIERVRSAAEAARAVATQAVAEQQALLDALGPPPAAGAPDEAPPLAEQRRRLNAALGAVLARQKQAEVTVARAQNLIDESRAVERRRVAEQLLTKGPTPLEAKLWRDGGQQIAAFATALAMAPGEWWQSEARRNAGRTAGLHALVVLALLLVGLWPIRRWLLRRFGRNPAIAEPDGGQVLAAAFSEGFGRGILPALGAEAVRAVLALNGLLDTLFGAFVGNLLHGLALYFLVTGLATAAFAPGLPGWRAFHLTETSAGRIVQRFYLLAAVMAIAAVLNTMTTGIWGGEEEMNILRTDLVGFLFAAVLLTFTDGGLWHLHPAPRDDAQISTGMGRFARRLPWFMLPPALAAMLLGYGNLAEFVIVGLLLSGLASAIYILARSAVDAVLDVVLGHRRIVELQARLDTDSGGGGLRFWLGGAVELLLFLAYAFALTQAWRVPTDEVFDFARRAVEGFKFGGLTISVGDILAALALFAAGLFATRFGQNALRDRILPQTRLDMGVRHSLVAGIGYLGFIVALVLGISALGINLSNIALIAGALSVGIGFGLQNIVNNFVSGLILLVERPVKVGDWVVVGQHEGYVRRISVRATEIETFPRAAVIVPNSELLSSAVKNWTYKDKMGRIEVSLGLPYSADVARVREVLLDCVKTLPGILAYPAPYVVFREFGATQLQFLVRAFIADVEGRMLLESDLRFAIVEHFNREKLPLPTLPGPAMGPTAEQVERLIGLLAEKGAPERPAP